MRIERMVQDGIGPELATTFESLVAGLDPPPA
jgi:hypothetical protein